MRKEDAVLAARPKQRHIDCFLTIVREGTIAGASKRLSLTQPAVSRTLADLEEILGARLMERTRSGITLTAPGETFLRYASASASALDKGVLEIARSQRSPRLAVNVGVLPNVAASTLPIALKMFKPDNPDILVRVYTNTNRFLTQMLRQGGLDFMVGWLASPEDMSSLDFELLFPEDLVAVVRKGHPLLTLNATTNLNSAINDYPTLLPLSGTTIREDAEQLLISTGGEVANMIETLSVEFGRAYVSITDAVWVTPLGCVKSNIELGRLMTLPLDTGATRGAVGITRQKNMRLSPYAMQLVQLIRKISQT